MKSFILKTEGVEWDIRGRSRKGQTERGTERLSSTLHSRGCPQTMAEDTGKHPSSAKKSYV